jgi:gluconolactonase
MQSLCIRTQGLLAALLLLLFSSVVGSVVSSQGLNNGDVINGSITSIPYEYTYLLPSFDGNIFYTFVNGTNTTDDSVNKLFQNATKAPFISYDDEFLELLGDNPQITLVEKRDTDFAYEAGVWIPEKNTVWFTSAVSDGPPHFEVLNLTDNSVYNVTTKGGPFQNPNGGYYFNGSVYFATIRDPGNYTGGVAKVDVNTLEAGLYVNSYFGLRFDDIDDIAWTTQANGKSYMYFSNLAYAQLSYPKLPAGQLTNAIWRFDPQKKLLLPVIENGDIEIPNGIRATHDGKTLYVANFGGKQFTDGNYSTVLAEVSGPSVFKYDLDDEGFPVNRKLFSYTRQGGADGLHLDDAGRVWTGEGEGIVVRNPDGRVIGVFNVEFFNPDHPLTLPIANFALAGDEVIVLGTNYLWRVKLAKTIATKFN